MIYEGETGRERELRRSDERADAAPLHRPQLGDGQGHRETYRQRRRFGYRVMRPFRRVFEGEMLEALLATHTGKQKLRRDRANNVIKLVKAVQRWASQDHTGEGSTSYLALVRELYAPDATWEDVDRHRSAIWQWARHAEAAGLAKFRPLIDEHGATCGLTWQLLDPQLHCEALRRSSSVGWSSGQWRRRRDYRQEHRGNRVAPWRERAGRQGSVGPFVCRRAAPPVFFDRQDRECKRLSCSSSSPTLRDGRLGAHARGAAGADNGNGNGSSEDRGAIPPPFRVLVGQLRRRAKAAAPRPVAQSASALEGSRQARLEWLADQAEHGADPRAVVFAAFEEWHGHRAWLSRLRWTQLENALRLADRVADFGAGRRGAGAAFVVDCMLFPDTERRIWADPGRPGKRFDEPGSLCLYVDELRHAARRWQRGARARAAAC